MAMALAMASGLWGVMGCCCFGGWNSKGSKASSGPIPINVNHVDVDGFVTSSLSALSQP